MRLTRRRVLLGLPLLVLVMTALRETGVADFELARTASFSQDNSALSNRLPPDAPAGQVSYEILMADGSLLESAGLPGRHDGLRLQAQVVELKIEGPIWLPLYKSLQADYRCVITSTPPELVSGEVKGKWTLQITGLCSARRARRMVEERIALSVGGKLRDFLQDA